MLIEDFEWTLLFFLLRNSLTNKAYIDIFLVIYFLDNIIMFIMSSKEYIMHSQKVFFSFHDFPYHPVSETFKSDGLTIS